MSDHPQVPEIKPALPDASQGRPIPEALKAPEIKLPPKEAVFEAGEKEKIGPEKPKEGFLEETISALKSKLRSAKRKPTTIPQVRDEMTVNIEKIMEEGLQDAYRELTPIQRQEFKIKGEETAFKIRDLLRAAHLQVKKIFRLLLEWLKMLPGINRFFLEQEAKIKTDKIIALKQINNRK